MLRYSTIFNAAQVDSAPSPHVITNVSPRQLDATPVFDRFVANTGAIIVPGSQASYVPALDLIRMRLRDTFITPEGYTARLSHELVH